jgi:hypothetical protein
VGVCADIFGCRIVRIDFLDIYRLLWGWKSFASHYHFFIDCHDDVDYVLYGVSFGFFDDFTSERVESIPGRLLESSGVW